MLVAVVLVLSCQSNPPIVGSPATPESIVERNGKLAALKPWRALGSLVVDSDRQGVVNASFAWDASNDGFDIKLFGPLGVQSFRIIEQSGTARLISKDEEFTGETAELLLMEALGVRIPLRSMQDWVVGLEGTALSAERDRTGLLREMVVAEQSDQQWDVLFQRYTRVDDLDLPKAIRITGNGVKIQLSVKKWTRPDAVSNGRLSVPGLDS